MFSNGGEDTKADSETMTLSTAVNLEMRVKGWSVEMLAVVFAEINSSVVLLIGMLSTSSIKCVKVEFICSKVAFDCEPTLYTDDCGGM